MATKAMSDALIFFCNGKKVVERAVDPEMTLITYLRTKLFLTGTKLACGEGGCGACTVMVSRYDHHTKQISHLAVNACLAPVCSVHGMAVTTVEGIGSTETKLHPVQERLARAHGSQCGFCTPGIVMSMYALLRNSDHPSTEEMLDAFQGNLCRCTGYRPIIEGYKTFTKMSCPQGLNCCQYQKENAEGRPSKSEGANGTTTCRDSSEAGRGRSSTNGPHYGITHGTNCQSKTAKSKTGEPGEGRILLNGDQSYQSVTKGVNGSTDGRDEDECQGDASKETSLLTCHKDEVNNKKGPSQRIDVEMQNGHDLNANQMEKNLEEGVSKMATDLFRSSEFTPYDASQEPIFPPKLMVDDQCFAKSIQFISDRLRWYRPITLDELLQLKAQYPRAKVVAGNTEIGVEVKFKDRHYPVLIATSHIEEMSQLTLLEGGVLLGASATLTNISKFLKECIQDLPGNIHVNNVNESSVFLLEEWQTRSFMAIVDMLHWFSGTQIRNVASVGGNIMTGSPISDLNPLFMAAESTLHVVSSKGRHTVPMDQNFFPAYRKTRLKPEEVLTAIFVPFTTQREFFHGFKQSQRRDDDIAIVNAGMRVRFKEGSIEVEDLRLAYGGMAATTVMATRTMNRLLNREWNGDLLEAACSYLPEDLPLSPGAPGGRETYRQSLALSFFFKFYLKVLEDLRNTNIHPNLPNIPPSFHSAISSRSGSDTFESTQLFEEVPSSQPEVDLVGRPIMHTAALQQTTGEAVYLDDIPKIENELHMAFVFSERAHARIISVDYSETLSTEGVVDIVTHMDVPGMNKVNFNPEDLFAVDEVTCVGQVVAAVLAETKSIAQRAAKLVKVMYESLDVTITLEDALEQKRYMVAPRRIIVGDVKAALSKADHVIEGECRVGAQEHFYMETHAAIAIPRKEDSEMEIISSDQNPTGTQINIADVLGVKRHKVVCRTKRIGGGFGGKETRAGVFASAVAVAAKKVRRPVRFVLDRDEDMRSSGARSSMLGRYRVGCTKEGKILGLELVLAINAGHTIDLSNSVCMYAMMALDSVYRIPNIHATGYVCQTNIPSFTAMRGFGTPQSLFITETWISDIAATCGISQKEVREINFLQPPHELSMMNQCWEDWNIPRCWQLCLSRSNYDVRRREVDRFNKLNRWKKRGLAIIPSKFGIGFIPKFMNQAGALVHIYSDGSVLISHGGIEMGQGLHTKMIQVASKSLGIPQKLIHISETNTDKVPNTTQTAGSTGSDLNGVAVKKACDSLMKRLGRYKMANPGGSWEDWVSDAYLDGVSLSAVGFCKPHDDHGFDFESRTGRQYMYLCFGVGVSEVEIDCLTGDHQLLRTDIVMDVGRSINPAVDIGQIEGAFIQGYGLFVLEDYYHSTEGRLLSCGSGAYKIPSFRDIPKEFNVYLLDRAPNPKAICSSKAVGEPPLFLSSSVFFAIKDAIASARSDVGLTGTFRLDSPACSERIRMACQDQFTQKFKEPAKGLYKPFFVRP